VLRRTCYHGDFELEASPLSTISMAKKMRFCLSTRFINRRRARFSRRDGRFQNILKPAPWNSTLHRPRRIPCRIRSVPERDRASKAGVVKTEIIEPTIGETYEIFKRLEKRFYEDHHKVRYSDRFAESSSRAFSRKNISTTDFFARQKQST